MIDVAFQEIIVKLKDNFDVAFGILDEDFVTIACTEMERIGEDFSYLQNMHLGKVPLAVNGKTYTRLDEKHLVFVDSDKEIASKYANILTITFSQTSQKPAQINKTEDFIKAVLFGDILDGDIDIRAREMLVESNISRVVLLFQANQISLDTSLKSTLENIFSDNPNDFAVEISTGEVAVVKVLDDKTAMKNLTEFAKALDDTLNAEFFINANIGIGAVVNSLKEVSLSFKKAQTALEIAQIFELGSIVNSNRLGLGRLIYQMPKKLCDEFLKEVFIGGKLDSLDDETLATVQKLFEYNLNVSETSRKLFVHRNTLIYRLEKVRQLTGLDLRKFEDAIVFQVASLVKKYLDADPARL